jgi:hypothetical protein
MLDCSRGLAVAFSLPLFRCNEQGKTSASSAQGVTVASILDQMVLLAPGLMVLVLVSSQDGFSHHFRYVLPLLPFVYIWISKVAGWVRRDSLLRGVLVLFCLAWTVGSSLAVFPHSMSYFNELAGGPVSGHRYMLHSSFAWSQDDFYLKRWVEAHPEVDPSYIHLERAVSLERLGLRGRGSPPKSTPVGTRKDGSAGQEVGPVPGWHGMQKASFRGWGTVRVGLTRNGQELFGNVPGVAQMAYTGGPILSPANEYPLPDYIGLGYFRSEVWKYAFQKGTMIHLPAIVAARFGRGNIILFSPHPETAPGLERWLIRSIRACARQDERSSPQVQLPKDWQPTEGA